MNKQLRKDIALVRNAFINGYPYSDINDRIVDIEKFLSGRIDDIKSVHVGKYSTFVRTTHDAKEFRYYHTYTTNLIPAIVHIVSSFYKNLDMLISPSKANKFFLNKVLFLDKDTELKFYGGLGDIENAFAVGFECHGVDTRTYVFDDKNKKYTKKFWKRLGAHRLEIIKYFKRIEKSNMLNKHTIDSHVAHHLRKYYNSLSPSEKLEVELDL